jgi:hypothetical protein
VVSIAVSVDEMISFKPDVVKMSGRRGHDQRDNGRNNQRRYDGSGKAAMRDGRKNNVKKRVIRTERSRAHKEVMTRHQPSAS